MTAPLASIVVPTRGGSARLPRLFAALRAQTEPAWEAIVVVDGDIDGSAAVIAEAAADLPVRALVLPENRGRSAALNAGFADARGGILIRCDDDLRPGPEYVAAHVARHAEGVCGVIGLYRNVYPDTAYARAYGRERDGRFRADAYAAPAESAWRYWAGNVSVARETYDRIGDYDTAFRAYGWEDVDWGYRLHQSGIGIVLAPELETPHHVAATTTEVRVTRAFLAGAAKRAFDAKHGLAPSDLARSDPASGGSASTAPAGVWNRLVHRTAARHGLAELQRRARTADRVVARSPRWLAEKHVAWLVESAGLSGALHPDEVTAHV
ncbi:glycosyltransferase family 2 protein [Microbacterium panaciterrae]|uniref:Glycosyltransferase family 2 protein n=1 Tax=Microbacterium panaciterrae TaxID=985759 RepID=A0ABP8PEQ5_9MICO